MARVNLSGYERQRVRRALRRTPQFDARAARGVLAQLQKTWLPIAVQLWPLLKYSVFPIRCEVVPSLK